MYMKLFLLNIIDIKGSNAFGRRDRKTSLFVIPCAELRFVWNIVNVHVYTVKKF